MLKSISMLVFMLAMLSTSSVAETAEITFESLLEEMADAGTVARFPEPSYSCKQSSSYNRLAKTPDDPEGWFSNGDNVGIVRTEEHAGRTERVLMEHAGPGVITRIWMPHMRPDHEMPPMDAETVIRFYLDGSAEPAIEANVHELITGRHFIKPPFAYISLNAGVVYLPIPFAKGCKITLDKDPFYYIINYRAYDDAAKVRSFQMQQYDLARPTLGRIGRLLLNPPNFSEGKSVGFDALIAKGKTKAVDLPKGPAAIRYLELKLDPKVDAQVLRSTVLRMEFDGEETVWSPLDGFFGCGMGLNPFQGKYRQVSADGTLRCRWVMPYRRTGTITLENLGATDVGIKLKAVTGDWNMDERTMVFHANWRQEAPLPTRPRIDWNYLKARGKGVYVGDTLTIMNPVAGWWGEGDEKIWVDGDRFPSHFGTGTEDYYGYAWGGRGVDFYEKPFHAQVIAGPLSTYGYNVETRTRALDAIPFQQKLQLDMEVWHPREVETAYAVGTYWYAFPGVEHNRGPEPAEARRSIPQPPELKELPPSRTRAAKPKTAGTPNKIPGAIEFEDLKPTAKSENVEVTERAVRALRWSNGKQMLATCKAAGDFVEYEIPAEDGRAGNIIFHGSKGPRYGKCRISIQGKQITPVVDFNQQDFVATGPIDLGTFAPENGTYTVRFEAVEVVTGRGQSPAIAGLDCIILKKIEKREVPAADAITAAKKGGRGPNIILIFADDMGFGDIGVNGAQGYTTPHIDRMAAEGVQLVEFCAGRSVCSPSRAALMTGCYPLRVGVKSNFGPSSKNGLHPEEMTIADVVKQQGYATAMYGKWHLGHLPEFLPVNQGFDEYYGLPYSNDMWPFHPDSRYNFPDLPLMEGTRILEYNSDQTKLTTEYTERTIRFIREHKEEPFFIYLAHAMPHVPLFTSGKFSGKTKRGIFGDVLEEIDWSVGRILAALKQEGLDEDTLVIFTSDNGPWLLYGDHAGSAGPFREGKNTMFEGGMRVPCVMRWPGAIPAGTVCRELTSAIDILPTIAGLVGAPLPKRKIDGRDIWPLMSGEPGSKTPHKAFFYYYGTELQAVRSGKWKLHFPHSYGTASPPGNGGQPGTRGTGKIERSLFDLENDEGETKNVAADFPEVVERLKKYADEMRKDLGDSATEIPGPGIRELAWAEDAAPKKRRKK